MIFRSEQHGVTSSVLTKVGLIVARSVPKLWAYLDTCTSSPWTCDCQVRSQPLRTRVPSPPPISLEEEKKAKTPIGSASIRKIKKSWPHPHLHLSTSVRLPRPMLRAHRCWIRAQRKVIFLIYWLKLKLDKLFMLIINDSLCVPNLSEMLCSD